MERSRRRDSRGRHKNTSEPVSSTTVLQDRLLHFLALPIALLVAIAYCTIRPVADPDCWFHMAFGRYYLEHGSIPRTDIFSFASGNAEWISSGWIPSVLLQWLWLHVGTPGSAAGPIYMVFFVVAAAYMLIYLTGTIRYGSRDLIVLILFASLLAAYLRFNPRPDVWSQFFMTVVMLLLVTSDPVDPRNPRRFEWRLFILPVVVMLWANFHAGFLIGLVGIAFYAVHRLVQWKSTRNPAHLLAILPLALCFVAWLVNPYGYKLAILPERIRSIAGFERTIYEWMPLVTRPGLNLPWPTYVGVGLLVAVGLWGFLESTGPGRWWRYLFAALTVVFTFQQRRQAGIMAVTIPIILLPDIRAMEARLPRSQMALIVAVLLAAGSVCALKSSGVMGGGKEGPRVGRQCDLLPCFTADWLAANRPPVQMFNTYGIGGYLLYFLGPETRVFIDGRLDLYPPQVWSDYLAVDENRMSLDAFAEKYGIQSWVVYMRDADDDKRHIAHRLTASKGHKLVYFDDRYMVFVRDIPANRGYLASREFLYANPLAPERLEAAARNPKLSEAANAEIKRAAALTAPIMNANAMALAAVGARASGEKDEADQILQQTLKFDPHCFLALRQAGQAVGPME